MAEDRNSYRSITKSIGIFGGTKVFQILVGLIQNKIIALLLGPVGMGIQGMLMSTINLIKSLTGLGLHTSAVRDVAKAHASHNDAQISLTVSILRRLVILTGLLGSLFVLVFAQPLSQWSFGNSDYTNAFRLVAIVLFFDQIVVGQTVLLQGTFHYKYMALSSLMGSILGLLASVPLYYIWGDVAIPIVIIVISIGHLFMTSYYARKIPFTKKKLSWKEVWTGGKIMITLGVALALSGVVNTGTVYAVRAFLNNYGTIETVGLYTAGSTIVTQYVNVILQAMGSDYSPRLAAVSDDRETFIETINRQAILLVTLIAPLVILFVVFAPQLILILFSSKFLPIIGMIEWMMVGMLFRAISWAMSFSFAARGDSKIFFINELLSSSISIGLTVLGFVLFGYTGLGIAFCMTYVAYMVQVYAITRKTFGFHFSKEVHKQCLPLVALCFIVVVILKLIPIVWIKLLVGIFSLCLVSYISYRLLDKMIGVASLLKSFKNKVVKK